MVSISFVVMGPVDVGVSGWDLPPLDVDCLPEWPPADRGCWGGVVLGSALGVGSAAVVDESPVDLGVFVAGGLAAVQPGLAELARLGSTDFAALSLAEQLTALLAFDRQQAWLAARQQELLALISARESSEEWWCVEEVGAALRLSGPVARSRLHNAEQLCARLPETLQALSDGVIAAPQAVAITEASYQLGDDLLPAFQDRVLDRAAEQSLTQLKRAIKRAVLCLDPRAAEQRRQRATADRQVRLAPAEDDLAWIMALLPAADAQAVYHRVDGVARQAPKADPRTLDQLRADALVNGILNGPNGRPSGGASDLSGGTSDLSGGTSDLSGGASGGGSDLSGGASGGGSDLSGGATGLGELPTAHGRRPRIEVLVGLSTLLGQDDEPGWLNGYGPISAGYARELAHDPTGTWRRLLTDPVSGQLLDYGTTRYRPPRQLAEHVIARDGECGFPFCSHPARRSDLDHIKPYPQGETSAANLQPLHRRHHNAKTRAGWLAHRDDSTGTTHWTSPQGRRYRTSPPQRWTIPPPPPLPNNPTPPARQT